MDGELVPLNDEECLELIELFRFVRDGRELPGEAERLKVLMERFKLNQKRLRPEATT